MIDLVIALGGVGFVCSDRDGVVSVSFFSGLVRPASLEIKEHFIPLFVGEHLHAYCKPRDD